MPTRPSAFALLGALLSACGLSSLDPYFACPGLGPECASLAGSAGSAGNATGGSSDAGAGLGGSSDAGASGALPTAGASGSCTSSNECGAGTCFRGECGPALELSYLDTPTDTDPNNAQWIKFQIQIKNRTTNAVPLAALKVRYYYTPENVSSELKVLSVSTLPARDSDLTGTFGVTELAGSRQWTVLELGFVEDAGMLGAGQSTGPIKVGIHDQDFGLGRFYQPGDYSYLESTHLTLYENDALLSGTPPGLPPAD